MQTMRKKLPISSSVIQSWLSFLRSFLPLPLNKSCNHSQEESKSNTRSHSSSGSKEILNNVNQDQTGSLPSLLPPGSSFSKIYDKHESIDVTKDDLISEEKSSIMIPYLREEGVKNEIFSKLKDIFFVVCEYLIKQSNEEAGEKGENRNSNWRNNIGQSTYVINSIDYAEYFETLRLCITGIKVKDFMLNNEAWIRKVSSQSFQLLWKIDEEGRLDKRPSADFAKGELIKFIECLFQLESNVILEVFLNGSTDSDVSSSDEGSKHIYNDRKQQLLNENARDDSITKMLEIYVKSSRSNCVYNNQYMTHYYSLLLSLAEINDKFCQRMLDHDNWGWSFKSFVLGSSNQDSSALYQTILNGTLHHVKNDKKFARRMFDLLVTCEGNGSLLGQMHLETASLQVLFAIFSSGIIQSGANQKVEDCISDFIEKECNGLSQLSAKVKTFYDKLDEEESSCAGIVLQGLHISVECMLLVLNSFDLHQVRTILENTWPEVDDIQSICTQLITRGESQWEKSYGDKNEGKMDVIRIIANAKKLLNILASVEAILQRDED